ncbi:outer membrane OprD family porin [Serratia fonticola]|uniref:Outer membrane OprD family porin n=1 Tax=Serratia fonticola TaxID=47917 RepID=A0A559T3K9_SERFO|nr:OprD family outer membrane porin [Serratia fonticola]TQI78312.1 outer membrane OprD family porin [Serratia fonticola]TQI94690.1 outer membrane OprD family porin [Serratia fonticola]TVZ69189.1 outer membrane OprD family porin [Serratia fonticola]
MKNSASWYFIVISLLSTGAQAADESFLSSPFFSDSQAELSLKNYWKYLKEDAANPKEVHNAWGQGVALGYQSGYLADIIGVNLDYYSAVKLGASDYFNTRGVLYNNGPGNNKNNAAGYSKIGQRYVKLKGDVGGAALNAQAGWQTLRNYGVISNSTRLSPTTYLGWSGGVAGAGLSLRGAYVERSMDRNSPDSLRLQTNDGRYINHLASGELGYESKTFNGQLAYGESQNYLRRQIVRMGLKANEKLSLGSQIYTTQALDDYKQMALGKRNFDRHANHYAFDAKWQEPLWSLKLGVAHTRAPKGGGELGFYPRHMSKNSRGTFTSMAYAGEDYMRDGETMMAAIAEYRITPEFTAGLTGNVGQFSYQGAAVRTGEINVFGRWVPTHPKLKNLTVFGMAGPGWSYKNVNKTPVLADGHYQTSHSLSAEFIAEYRFKLF